MAIDNALPWFPLTPDYIGDNKKIKEMNDAHEEDRAQWGKIDKEKDKIIGDFINNKQ